MEENNEILEIEDIVLDEKLVKLLDIDICEEISKKMNINIGIVKNIVEMIEDGNTIPFIARYRKEKTNGMQDEVLREFENNLKTLINLIARKQEVAKILKQLDKLDEELKKQLILAKTITEVEDIYRPFKGKKKTRATEAKRKGLQGLSEYILKAKTEDEVFLEANNYLNKEVLTVEDAKNGACDIIAENISDNADIRKKIKEIYLKDSEIISKKSKSAIDEKKVYTVYYDFKQLISKIPSHRYLAITRGEKEKILDVKFEVMEDKIYEYILKYEEKQNGRIYPFLEEIVKDSFKRLIKSSIERELRADLKEKSDEVAIKVFGTNLKELLMQPPIKNVKILGYDPGFRNGSKLATIDENGKFTDSDIIYVTMPQDDKEKGIERLKQLITKNDIDVVAIGNGTASRESEKIVADVIRGTKTEYIIVSEAGASVYSASKIAKEEFPDVNVSIRGAISIARRLQDPLSELVKIEPKSIGVGQYQHDVNQKELEEQLHNVVEDVVNKVGVDLNTATFSLLSYVSGINKKQAKAIVKYREENGKYLNRAELKKVAGIGDKAFNQSAGFLRIYNGKNPLEITGIHPESYELATKIFKYLDLDINLMLNENGKNIINEKIKNIDIDKMLKTEEFKQYGKYEITDTLMEIQKPGLDIRDELEKPLLRSDVLDAKDVQIGMELQGTVRNVAAFGVFVDIGLHQDGFIHISELSDKFVKNPADIVKVGEILTLKVITKDEETEKIGLSLKQANNK